MKIASLRRGLVIVLSGLLISAIAQNASAARFVDRLYQFGDDPIEAAADGAFLNSMANNNPSLPRNSTADSAGVAGAGAQFVDLNTSPFGTARVPKYVALGSRIPNRPDGGAGFAVEFDGTRQDNLFGIRFGTPETSRSSIQAGGSIDYFFILDRGMQFWTYPTALPQADGEDAHIVMDTNNHGALINTRGRFTMRYNGEDFEGVGYASEQFATNPGLADPSVAAEDEWYHVMVVRPDRVAPTSIMYVNGVAIAAAAGDYLRGVPPLGTVNDIPDSAPLVVGGGTNPSSQTDQGRFANFTGVVDDLELFALGFNAGSDGIDDDGDFGLFDFAIDNGYAAQFGPSNVLDLANDDNIVDIDDVSVFVDNWLFEKKINGIRVGDLETVALGDFNYSGRVDIDDWGILNAANPAMAAKAFAMIQAVPEPATLTLAAMLLSVGSLRRR